jgi:hypothetical protein
VDCRPSNLIADLSQLHRADWNFPHTRHQPQNAQGSSELDSTVNILSEIEDKPTKRVCLVGEDQVINLANVIVFCSPLNPDAAQNINICGDAEEVKIDPANPHHVGSARGSELLTRNPDRSNEWDHSPKVKKSKGSPKPKDETREVFRKGFRAQRQDIKRLEDCSCAPFHYWRAFKGNIFAYEQVALFVNESRDQVLLRPYLQKLAEYIIENGPGEKTKIKMAMVGLARFIPEEVRPYASPTVSVLDLKAAVPVLNAPLPNEKLALGEHIQQLCSKAFKIFDPQLEKVQYEYWKRELSSNRQGWFNLFLVFLYGGEDREKRVRMLIDVLGNTVPNVILYKIMRCHILVDTRLQDYDAQLAQSKKESKKWSEDLSLLEKRSPPA